MRGVVEMLARKQQVFEQEHAERSNRGRQTMYPWDDLEVGDSFTVPCSKEDQYRTRKRMYGNLTHRRRRWGQEYSLHYVDAGVLVRREA